MPCLNFGGRERDRPHASSGYQAYFMPVADEVRFFPEFRELQRSPAPFYLFGPADLVLFGLALPVNRDGVIPRELAGIQEQVVPEAQVKFSQSPIALLTCSAIQPMEISMYAALNASGP